VIPAHKPKTFDVIATECTLVADKLLQNLQRLKCSGKRRPWGSIRHALDSVWSKGEIDALESRLNSYRQQLILQKVFAPDKHIEYASFDKRFDSLDDANAQVLSQLTILAKALVNVQDIQKHAASGTTTVPTPKGLQHCEDGNSTDSPGVMLQENATASTSKQLETLQAKVEQLQNIVMRQPEMIASLLARETTTAHKDLQFRQESYEDEGDQVPTSHEEASQLSRSLNELYRFALKTGATFCSEDVHLVIENLDQILDVVEQASRVSQLDHASRKRRRSSSPHKGTGARQQKVRAIKRIRGLLNSSQSISVNQPGETLYCRLFSAVNLQFCQPGVRGARS
jgi:hypothetical protein